MGARFFSDKIQSLRFGESRSFCSRDMGPLGLEGPGQGKVRVLHALCLSDLVF